MASRPLRFHPAKIVRTSRTISSTYTLAAKIAKHPWMWRLATSGQEFVATNGHSSLDSDTFDEATISANGHSGQPLTQLLHDGYCRTTLRPRHLDEMHDPSYWSSFWFLRTQFMLNKLIFGGGGSTASPAFCKVQCHIKSIDEKSSRRQQNYDYTSQTSISCLRRPRSHSNDLLTGPRCRSYWSITFVWKKARKNEVPFLDEHFPLMKGKQQR